MLSAMALTVAAAHGQHVLWTHTGTQGASILNGQAAAIGDVDGDGWSDVVQAVWVYVGGQAVVVWEIWTFSGRDGRRLRTLRAPPGPGYTPFAVGIAGDVDGDGIGDYAVGWWDQGCCRGASTVQVRSGRDDRLVWQATNTWESLFGFCVASVGDVDGDGRSDVGIAAPRDTPYGTVFVYSSTGNLLHRIVGSSSVAIANQGWQTIARVGDIDGDRRDDFVVGGAVFNGPGGAFVFSGRTGQVLVRGMDPQPGDNLGASVDGCGDMDGDGVPDFVVGSWGGLSTPGLVTAFSGRDGQPIRTWRPADLGRTGLEADTLRSGGRDFDQDGVPDVLLGSDAAGAIWVLSGRDGSVIFRLEGQGGSFGGYASILGSQPGSPYPHFVVVQSRYQYVIPPPFSYLGRLLCFAGSPRGVEVYGQACAGALASEPSIGLRDLSPRNVRVSVHGAQPSAPAALMLGCSRTSWGPITLPFPLTPFGLPQCQLFTSVELTVPVVCGATGLAAGYAAVELPGRLDATGPFRVFAQWWCLPRSGFPGGVSDAVAFSGR